MVKIKVMPGHKTKINQLVDYIKTIIPDIMYEPVRKKEKESDSIEIFKEK